jgi:hypothetical protein
MKMQTVELSVDLKSCPFCGFNLDVNDEDCIYPVGRPMYDLETDKPMWRVYNIVCYETGGGCGASVLGDSPEDCIDRWNSRVTSGIYFSSVSLGVFTDNMCIPYKPDEFNTSFTEEYFGDDYYFDKENMVVQNLRTTVQKKITEWTNVGIQFIPFKL